MSNSFLTLKVGTALVPNPSGGMFPAVGMRSNGEEVRINLEADLRYLCSGKDRIRDVVDSSLVGLAKGARFGGVNISGDHLR